MSARPRPVTATVNPPLTSTPLHGPRTFLSSDGSTESLISVLDHDSCQSLPSSDDDQDQVPKKPVTKDQKTNRKSKESRSETVSSTTRTSTTEPTDTSPTEGKPPSRTMTPWEDWMIRKAKDIRIKQENEVKKLKRLEQEKKKEEKIKQEKQKKCEKNVAEWNERKMLEYRTRKKMENRRLNTEKELKEAKKREIEQKADVKYAEWQRQKMEEEKERKRQEKLKKEQEQKEKEERQKKCEEKYKAWLKEAKKRPRSAPHSYGYSEGKLTGYYDRCAHPVPSFYNPIPWQPIPVPNQGTEKKNSPKKKVRRRPNPNRYF